MLKFEVIGIDKYEQAPVFNGDATTANAKRYSVKLRLMADATIQPGGSLITIITDNPTEYSVDQVYTATLKLDK